MTAIILRRRKLGLTSCKGISAASTTGISFVRNDQMKEEDFNDKTLVIRWGCTSSVPIKSVLNTADAIHLVSDKARFRKLLQDNAETKDQIPLTFFDFEEACDAMNKGMKLFVRPKHHAQGKNVFVVDNDIDFLSAVQKCGDGWYASQLINKVAEYRVFIVQGKVVWVANKTPANPDAYAWNVAQGGKFENVKWGDWDLSVCHAAINAIKLSGLDFGGVDVMVDDKGKPHVIEINSAPSQTSPYRQQCTAKAFDYVVEQGKEFIQTVMHYGNWRDYIHPGIWKKGNA